MKKPRRDAQRGRGNTARRQRPRTLPPSDDRASGHAAAPERAATPWDDVASWYDSLVGDEGSEYQREVIIPGVLRLLNLNRSERVLDVGCGQGVVSRVLHHAGAIVTGIDASSALVRLARQRSDASIRFIEGDARALRGIPAIAGQSFDAAVCILAIQNMHPIPAVFEGVAHAVKNSGRFVLVMMHPCFRAPKATQWGWDEQAGVQYRRVDRYLLPRKHPIVTHPGKEPGRYTWTFHRPLQSYMKALTRAGLLIDALEEWASHKSSQPGPRARAENRARQEIPMFLAVRARRAEGLQVTEREALERDSDVAD